MQQFRFVEGYHKSWGAQSVHTLTARERDILRLVAEGRGNQEIGEHLGISVRTVKVHMSNIFEKLGVNRRMEAAAILSSQPQYAIAWAS